MPIPKLSLYAVRNIILNDLIILKKTATCDIENIFNQETRCFKKEGKIVIQKEQLSKVNDICLKKILKIAIFIDKSLNTKTEESKKECKYIFEELERIGYINSLKVMLKSKIVEINHQTDFTIAIRNDQPLTVEFLLDKFPEGNIRKKMIFSVLMEAISWNKPDVFNQLFSMNFIDDKEINKIQLLFKAVMCGADKIIPIIVAKGAQIDAIDENKMTLLMHGAKRGYAQTVRTLLMLGANIDARDSQGKTALIHAIEKRPFQILTDKDFVEVVKVLLKFHADVHIGDYDNKTPLIYAISEGFGYPNILRTLLENSSINVNAEFFNGKTVLDLARNGCNKRNYEILVNHGAII